MKKLSTSALRNLLCIMNPSLRFSMFKQILLCFGFVLALSSSALQAELSMAMGEKGVASLQWNGVELLRDGPLSLDQLRFVDGEKKTHEMRGKHLDTWVDAEKNKVTAEYENCVIEATYTVRGSRLDVDVSVTNKSDRPVNQLSGRYLTLDLVFNPMNRPSTGIHGSFAVKEFDFRRIDLGVAHAFLVNWGKGRTNTGWGQGQSGPLTIEFAPTETPNHPVVDNRFFDSTGVVIPPGKTETFRFSLLLGEPDAPDEVLGADFFAEAAERHKPELQWPDRRPIGTLFLAHPTRGWATNPRGWIFVGEKGDITTEEGLKIFRERLMHFADESIKNLKEMDAQGMIFWDLEGAEFHHPITYIADPAKLPVMAPEMDRFADEFFKKFSDAGFKTGITIRPTDVYQPDPKVWKFTHREVEDPVDLMSRKIQYAKDRWGCSIFYLDSNVFNKDWLTEEQKKEMRGIPYQIPVGMIRALHERHPDVLIIPEWGIPEYFAYSAPYSHENLRQAGTPGGIRLRNPHAFSVVSNNRGLLRTRWDDFLNSVTNGDILLFNAWFADVGNPMRKHLLKEAEFRRNGIPPEVAKADASGLAKLLGSDSELVRYSVVTRLGEERDAISAKLLLQQLSKETSPIMKNHIFRNLAALPTNQIEGASTQLMQAYEQESEEPIKLFAAQAFGRSINSGDASSPAIQYLLSALSDPKEAKYSTGLEIAESLPESNSQVLQKLRAAVPELIGPNLERTIGLLGKFQDTESVPMLVDLLKHKDERVSIAAVKALGEIGDPRAIAPLVDLYDRGFGSVVIYSIRDQQDAALRKVTQTPEHRLGDQWRQWLKENPKSNTNITNPQ